MPGGYLHSRAVTAHTGGIPRARAFVTEGIARLAHTPRVRVGLCETGRSAVVGGLQHVPRAARYTFSVERAATGRAMRVAHLAGRGAGIPEVAGGAGGQAAGGAVREHAAGGHAGGTFCVTGARALRTIRVAVLANSAGIRVRLARTLGVAVAYSELVGGAGARVTGGVASARALIAEGTTVLADGGGVRVHL